MRRGHSNCFQNRKHAELRPQENPGGLLPVLSDVKPENSSELDFTPNMARGQPSERSCRAKMSEKKCFAIASGLDCQVITSSESKRWQPCQAAGATFFLNEDSPKCTSLNVGFPTASSGCCSFASNGCGRMTA